MNNERIATIKPHQRTNCGYILDLWTFQIHRSCTARNSSVQPSSSDFKIDEPANSARIAVQEALPAPKSRPCHKTGPVSLAVPDCQDSEENSQRWWRLLKSKHGVEIAVVENKKDSFREHTLRRMTIKNAKPTAENALSSGKITLLYRTWNS